MGPDGAMFCMPLNHKRVLRLAPSGTPPLTPMPLPGPFSLLSPPLGRSGTEEKREKELRGGQKQRPRERQKHTQPPQAALRSSAHSASYSRSRKTQAAPVGRALPDCLLRGCCGVLDYDVTRFDLRGSVTRLLQRAGLPVCAGFSGGAVGAPRLEDVRLPAEALAAGAEDAAQRRLTELVETDASLRTAWEALVRAVVVPWLQKRLAGAEEERGWHEFESPPRRFFVQCPPTLRLQPGPSTRAVRQHCDSEYGHQPGEVNFWMPLTDREETGTTLQVESAPGAGDFQALHLGVGQVGAFHGSTCRHFVPPNASNATRVSLDFRVGPEGYFDPQWSMSGTRAEHGRLEVLL